MVISEMRKNFPTQNSEAEMMKEVIYQSYEVVDIRTFQLKAEKVYNQAKFYEEAYFVLQIEALNGTSYCCSSCSSAELEVTKEGGKYCLDDAVNQKKLKNLAGKPLYQFLTKGANSRSSNDTLIYGICQEVEILHS